MILKGSQRSGGKRLAMHLLNDQDNEFVELHELRGFISDDLTGACKEVEAIAKGTRCKQPFFSVSLSPPPDASVPIESFIKAADKIEAANGLDGQPRAIIFHEKDGRRHAHVVFSRIDAQTMTARNLPHFKNRLQAVSRELFVEFGWKMPRGLLDPSQKNPTNVTLAEWQSAKRRGRNAIDQKALIAQCYAASDDSASFASALEERGYRLAKGDRRGHVVVAYDGEVIAVARAVGKRAKDVKAKLGEPEAEQSVSEALEAHRRDLRGNFHRMGQEARSANSDARKRLDMKRTEMIARHKQERETLERKLAERWNIESTERQRRFASGLRGIWHVMIGRRAKIRALNEREAYGAVLRDRAQRQSIIEAQLVERRGLEAERTRLRKEAFGLFDALRSDRDKLLEKLLTRPSEPKRRRSKRPREQNAFRDHGPTLEP